MFKVELKNRWYDDNYRIGGINKEMFQLRQWCLDNIGNAVDISDSSGVKYNWRGTTNLREDPNILYNKEYPVFYFEDQAHANWFTLRWSNGG
jgi:hypothetical protein